MKEGPGKLPGSVPDEAEAPEPAATPAPHAHRSSCRSSSNCCCASHLLDVSRPAAQVAAQGDVEGGRRGPEEEKQEVRRAAGDVELCTRRHAAPASSMKNPATHLFI